MVSEGKRDARRAAVATVASKLFGSEVKAENVVDETLQRAIQAPVPADGAPRFRSPSPAVCEGSKTPEGAEVWAGVR